MIAHIFSAEPPEPQVVAELRARLSAICDANDSELVDLVFDKEKATRRLTDYSSLVRIARGEADGIMLTRLPLMMRQRRSRDRLCALITGPMTYLSAQELRSLRLLPSEHKIGRVEARRAAAAGAGTEAAGMP